MRIEFATLNSCPCLKKGSVHLLICEQLLWVWTTHVSPVILIIFSFFSTFRALWHWFSWPNLGNDSFEKLSFLTLSICLSIRHLSNFICLLVFLFVYFVCLFFEEEGKISLFCYPGYVDQAGLKLSEIYSLCLPCAGLKNVLHYAWILSYS